jgi:hypothetical protein
MLCLLIAILILSAKYFTDDVFSFFYFASFQSLLNTSLSLLFLISLPCFLLPFLSSTLHFLPCLSNFLTTCIYFFTYISLKIWNLEDPLVRTAISKSYTEPRSASNTAFQTYTEQLPIFSSVDVHTGYVGKIKFYLMLN